MTGLAADEVVDALDRVVEELGELFELAALGVLERVEDDLDADLRLLLGVLGLGLLVLLRLLGGLALLRGDLLGLRLLRGVLHGLRGLRGRTSASGRPSCSSGWSALSIWSARSFCSLARSSSFFFCSGVRSSGFLPRVSLPMSFRLILQLDLLVEDLLNRLDRRGQVADLVHLLHRVFELFGGLALVLLGLVAGAWLRFSLPSAVAAGCWGCDFDWLRLVELVGRVGHRLFGGLSRSCLASLAI